MLRILGTEGAPGHNGAKLVEQQLWDQASFLDARKPVRTGDIFYDSRIVLKRRIEQPGLIDTVAAYPSRARWEAEVQPQKAAKGALEAQLQLTRPLLVPAPELSYEDALRQVVELAQDSDFLAARNAHHEWFRDLVRPLRRDGISLDEVELSLRSKKTINEELEQLWQAELQSAKSDKKRKWAGYAEAGCMTVGAAGAAWIAHLAENPELGIATGLLAFGGWVAGEARQQEQSPSLSGATMFIEARDKLDWD